MGRMQGIKGPNSRISRVGWCPGRFRAELVRNWQRSESLRWAPAQSTETVPRRWACSLRAH